MLEDFLNFVDGSSNCESILKPLVDIHHKLFESHNDDQVSLKAIEISLKESKLEVTNVDIDEGKQVLLVDQRVLIRLQELMVFSRCQPA